MRNRISLVIAYTSLLAGMGSMLLFTIFLFSGPFDLVCFNLTGSQAIIFDLSLSSLFFLQHSIMIRRIIRKNMVIIINEAYYNAFYSIVSAVVLTGMIILWQRIPHVLVSIEGIGYWLVRSLFLLSIAGFIWGITSIKSIDPYGVRRIRRHLHGKKTEAITLTARGAYKWVRHPLYICMIMMIWCTPQISLDRLIFNIAWTIWIVIGTMLEERDLVHDFGDSYREYQTKVPMLIPFRTHHH